jgi:hypothetical protein
VIEKLVYYLSGKEIRLRMTTVILNYGGGRRVQIMKTELQPICQRHDTDASTKTLEAITKFVVYIYTSAGFYCFTVLVKSIG